VHAPGSNTLEPSEDLIVRVTRWNPARTYLEPRKRARPVLPNPIASIPDRASRACRTLTIATSDLNQPNARSGESITHDSDGSESDSKPGAHDSKDSGIDKDSDEAIVVRYGWIRHSKDLWIPARPRPILQHESCKSWDGRMIGPEPFEGWPGRTPEEIAWDRRVLGDAGRGDNPVNASEGNPNNASVGTGDENYPNDASEGTSMSWRSRSLEDMENPHRSS
jgi:hypothetical protein